jgi:glycine hydroxymethyltransferase
VLSRQEHASAVDKAVFPGLQGGPLCHVVAAKAVCFKLAATEAFREYQKQIVANAKTLADTLMDGGLKLLTDGTDVHLLQVDLRDTQWSGKDAEERLHQAAITVNRNTVPFDERPPTIASGVRIGTPAATMRGFVEDDMREVGAIILETLDPAADLDRLRGRTSELLAERPLYPGFLHGYPAI